MNSKSSPFTQGGGGGGGLREEGVVDSTANRWHTPTLQSDSPPSRILSSEWLNRSQVVKKRERQYITRTYQISLTAS